MYSFKPLLLITILFIIALGTNAQSDDDTTRIIRFKRLHTVQFNTWVTDVDLMVNPLYKEKNYRLNFQPNTGAQAGVSLGLKKFTVALGFQIKGTESQTDVFGKTKYYDFTFGYFQRKFGGEVYYRSFQGMYSLPNDYEDIKIRPDVYIANGGLNFFYAKNHRNFSMRSVISQQEQQLQAAGSFILLTNVQFRTLHADSSIIPSGIDRSNIFYNLSGLKQMQFITLNIKPGYAHNFLIPKKYWFFSPSIYAGLGSGWYTSESYEGYKSGMPLDISLHSKTILGYNHPKWFVSAFYVYDGSINIFKNSFMIFNTSSFGLNVGYRLTGIGIKWL
jgi:hypothetical protein